MQVTYDQNELTVAIIDYVKNHSGINLEEKDIVVRFNLQGLKKREVYATVEINTALNKAVPVVETVEEVAEAPATTSLFS